MSMILVSLYIHVSDNVPTGALVRPGSALVLSRGSSRQQSRGRLLRPTSAAPFSSTRSVQGMPQRRPSTAVRYHFIGNLHELTSSVYT